MKKTAKAWLVAAASLVVIGCVLFAVVMSTAGRDRSKLSTVIYETNTYEITEAFSDLSLTTDTADIVFAPSGDGKCRVECYEEEHAKHSVSVENNTLTVSINDQRSWDEYIGFTFDSPKITVYLPDTEYGTLAIQESTGNVEIPEEFSFESVDISASTGSIDLGASARDAVRIGTSTGDIQVENISAGSLELSVSTGEVTVTGVKCSGDIAVSVSTGKAQLSDVSCESVISTGTTGNIYLDNVIAADKLSITRSTGNVSFDGSDAAEIIVRTDTGDITGSLLTDKVFIAASDTGSVEVPRTVTGGRCEIDTDTGNIKIEIE